MHYFRSFPQSVRVCLIFLAFLSLACVAGPWLVPFDPHRPDWDFLSAAPSFISGHWFGTDAIGRDILARTLAGGRLSLTSCSFQLGAWTAGGTAAVAYLDSGTHPLCGACGAR